MNRLNFALVGTLEIIRITKGPVLLIVEVEGARLDVNLQSLAQQLRGVVSNQT